MNQRKHAEKSTQIKKERLLLILLFIFIILAYFSYLYSNKTKTLETLFYTEKSNIDYQVCLNENNFYEERCQPKGMKYIASAINYINVDFSYDFETTSIVNYEYEYYIDGIITVFDRNDPGNILFTKTIKILNDKTDTKKGVKTFSINENFKINYQDYNDLIRLFKAEYNISADSSLNLKLYIKASANYEKFTEPIETSNELELTIPLTEKTINISMNYKEINNSDAFIQKADKTILNTIYFSFSIFFVIVSIIIVVSLGIRFKKREQLKSSYERFINNKLKNYDRLIVSAKDELKIYEEDYAEIIDVKDFNELVDIAERLVDLITWTEVTYPFEKISWFTIASHKRLYRIIYKSTDERLK